MVIFQVDIYTLYGHVFLRSILVLILLAVVVYFDFILLKPGELRGLYVLIKIIPTILFFIPIIFFASSVVDAIRVAHLWNNEKYFTVQGNIEDLVTDSFWMKGDYDEPTYDCSFVVDDVKFPFLLHYSAEQAQSLKNADKNKDIVKVSYLLDPSSKKPFPLKIEIVETEENLADSP